MLDRGEAVRKLVLNAARLTGAASLMAPYLGGIGAILMLHRVSGRCLRPDGVNRHLTVTPEFLDATIADVKALGYELVSMDEAVSRIGGKAGRRFAAITADDAYRDNLLEALPILEKHDAPITIYVSPGLTSGMRDLWWEVIEEIVSAREGIYLNTPGGRVNLDCATPALKHAATVRLHEYFTDELREEDQQHVLRDLALAAGIDAGGHTRRALMDWDEIRRISTHPLVTIGAHTVNHYNLKRLSADKARREIADAPRIIEMETGLRPRHMAYPYGYLAAVGEREVKLAAEAGFASAVTTRHGVLSPGHARHLHALPRISLNGRYQNVAHVRTMLSGITTPIANAGRRVVTV